MVLETRPSVRIASASAIAAFAVTPKRGGRPPKEWLGPAGPAYENASDGLEARGWRPSAAASDAGPSRLLVRRNDPSACDEPRQAQPAVWKRLRVGADWRAAGSVHFGQRGRSAVASRRASASSARANSPRSSVSPSRTVTAMTPCPTAGTMRSGSSGRTTVPGTWKKKPGPREVSHCKERGGDFASQDTPEARRHVATKQHDAEIWPLVEHLYPGYVVRERLLRRGAAASWACGSASSCASP
jgi:hypothetical protein